MTDQKDARPITGTLVLVPVTLILAAVFIWVSQRRLIDQDEGFYLLTAKLVFQGRILYHDTLFTQMPLSAYFYGLCMKIVPMGWYSGRIIAALLTTALGALLYWHVASICKSWVAGCVAAFLFGSSLSILAWYPIVKTYSLSILLLFAAYMLLADVTSRKGLLFSGLLLALAIDTRLYLGAIVPVFLVYIYTRRRSLPAPARTYGWFLGGLALGLAPNLPLFVYDPVTFYFDNIGYHTIRTEAGFIGDFHEKLGTLGRGTGLWPTTEAHEQPFLILILANAAAVLTGSRVRGPRAPLATWMAAVIIVVSVLPTPTFLQYFSAAVPFVIVGAVAFVWNYIGSRTGIAALAACLLIYIVPLKSDLIRYVSTGVGVIGIDTADKAVDFRISTVLDLTRRLDGLSRPGEQVWSLWPGYLVESHAEPLPGTENSWGLAVAPRLSEEQLKRYSILSNERIAAGVAHHIPCFVVGHPVLIANMLAAAGYKEAYSAGTNSIYICNR